MNKKNTKTPIEIQGKDIYRQLREKKLKMSNKPVKKCPISLVIRKMQIKKKISEDLKFLVFKENKGAMI